MHVSDKWKITDNKQIQEVIKHNAFALLVSPSLDASHLPLILSDDGEYLIGHFARSNTHCKSIDGEQVLAVFQAAHDYISPTWYEGKPAVPTWNYAAVHIKGAIELLGSGQTLEAVHLLVKKYEPSLLKENEVMTPEYVDKLSKGIVGFRIAIEHIDAKAKLDNIVVKATSMA